MSKIRFGLMLGGGVVAIVVVSVAIFWFGRMKKTQPGSKAFRPAVVIDTASATVNAATVIAKGEFQTIHRVKPGDSLWSISRKYGVTVQEIKDANREKTDLIKVGEPLVIPK